MSDPWALTYEDDTAALTDERLTYELLCGVDVHIPNTPLRTIYPTGHHDRAARSRSADTQGFPFPSLYPRDSGSDVRPRKRDRSNRAPY